MACCDTGLYLGLVLSVWSCFLTTPWRLSHISTEGACSLFPNSHVAFPHVDATDFITTVSTVSISNSCVVNRLHHFTVMRKYHVAFQVLARSGSASAREPLQASQDNPDPSLPPHPSSVYFLRSLPPMRKDGSRQPSLPTQPSLFWRQSYASEFSCIPAAVNPPLSTHPYPPRPGMACALVCR